MKKLPILLILLLVGTLSLIGCGKMIFSVAVGDNNTVNIEAENADADSFGGAGTFTVGENEKLSIETNFEGDSAVLVKFSAVDADIDTSAEDLQGMANLENADYELEVKGTEPITYDLPPGDYFVGITALNKCTGTATIRLVKDGSQQ